MRFFKNIYQNKTVLITGHTGFKGSWLALFLHQLGAKVIGYALPAPTEPNHFDMLGLPIENIFADINDFEKLKQIIQKYQPEIIFHLAAQALVRKSYREPLQTYQTNLIGTLNLYEAARSAKSIKAIVSITSDKVYKNEEWIWAYRENDALGGYDMYSSSKACAEILTQSFRNSFFNLKEYGISHQMLIATARAGNVIGGGDWAEDRLIPDIIKASSKNDKTIIRNPQAVRPWQHVLEPLSGYLLLGQKLLEGDKHFSGEWNFGPNDSDCLTVGDVADSLQKYWTKIRIEAKNQEGNLHEAGLLRVDSSKARQILGWQTIWNAEKTFEKTIDWYRNFYESQKVNSLADLECYINQAVEKQLIWTR